MEASFANGNPTLQKEYSIAPHMYDSAFKDWQRKFVYPKNYIMTGVFALLAVVDIILVVAGKFSPAVLVLVLVCIGVIVAMWNKTNSIRKKFVQNMAKFKDERQTVRFYEGGIIINKIPKGNANPEEIVIDFSKNDVKLLDGRYYFIAYVDNNNFNIIPKKVFDAVEEGNLAKNFKSKLGANYISIK